MGKKYAILQKRVEALESQLIPILSIPLDPETPKSHQPISDGINQQLLFINNLLNTEIALSPAPDESHRHHLAQIARRVRLLQSTLRTWAEARPTVEPLSASTCSCTGSCLAGEDEDEADVHEDGEESPLTGFSVYNNPEFGGSVDGDVDHDCDNLEFVDSDGGDVPSDDDDGNIYHDHHNLEFVGSDCGDVHDDDDWNDEEEYEGINQEEEEYKGINQEEEDEDEEETIEIDNREEERREKVGDEEEEEQQEDDDMKSEEGRTEKTEEGGDGEDNCCFRVIFVIIMTWMGFIFLMIGFSEFSDYHQPVGFLTPT